MSHRLLDHMRSSAKYSTENCLLNENLTYYFVKAYLTQVLNPASFLYSSLFLPVQLIKTSVTEPYEYD